MSGMPVSMSMPKAGPNEFTATIPSAPAARAARAPATPSPLGGADGLLHGTGIVADIVGRKLKGIGKGLDARGQGSHLVRGVAQADDEGNAGLAGKGILMLHVLVRPILGP